MFNPLLQQRKKYIGREENKQKYFILLILQKA